MTKAIFAICLLMLCGCEETIEWTNVSHNFPRHCPSHTTAISSRPIMWLWEGEKRNWWDGDGSRHGGLLVTCSDGSMEITQWQ